MGYARWPDTTTREPGAPHALPRGTRRSLPSCIPPPHVLVHPCGEPGDLGGGPELQGGASLVQALPR